MNKDCCIWVKCNKRTGFSYDRPWIFLQTWTQKKIISSFLTSASVHNTAENYGSLGKIKPWRFLSSDPEVVPRSPLWPRGRLSSPVTPEGGPNPCSPHPISPVLTPALLDVKAAEVEMRSGRRRHSSQPWSLRSRSRFDHRTPTSMSQNKEPGPGEGGGWGFDAAVAELSHLPSPLPSSLLHLYRPNMKKRVNCI